MHVYRTALATRLSCHRAEFALLLAIYTRDEGGVIAFHGVEKWSSLQAYIVAHPELADQPAEHADLVGWPDSSLVWLGNTGIAVRWL
ncbi:hypothetical protein L861_23345 [Litchfieldella anticariensis FP35 = DSM 16096]|uniref:Uncharacterized protein n=1 Tax=Litchfieldella anticariensis (strain DSM 16096 / CECT 5854 / CIP 108499 / LMG 22089 / FP35) TaxID=1121939 RepID=S2KRW6_LITA3|nr:hypothetical protein [Halomonas anticariensis]EPC03248.1 hypothetical protein L861_23345 [Halomonas anticariensis FP35 = DSM 16096]